MSKQKKRKLQKNLPVEGDDAELNFVGDDEEQEELMMVLKGHKEPDFREIPAPKLRKGLQTENGSIILFGEVIIGGRRTGYVSCLSRACRQNIISKKLKPVNIF